MKRNPSAIILNFLITLRDPAITHTVVDLRLHIFSISISRSLYLLILLYALTDMLLSVDTAISIRRHSFLFLFLSTIFGLLLSIFYVWIARYQRIVALLASVIGSGWCLYHFSDCYQPICLLGRVFANAPGDWGSIPGWVIPKTQKMVLDISLLNTQHYKAHIKGKVKQSKERSSALPYTLV